MKWVWHRNNKDTPMCHTLSFSDSQIFLIGCLRKKSKIDLSESLDLCQIPEIPRFHLKDDGTIFLFLGKLALSF